MSYLHNHEPHASAPSSWSVPVLGSLARLCFASATPHPHHMYSPLLIDARRPGSHTAACCAPDRGQARIWGVRPCPRAEPACWLGFDPDILFHIVIVRPDFSVPPSQVQRHGPAVEASKVAQAQTRVLKLIACAGSAKHPMLPAARPFRAKYKEPSSVPSQVQRRDSPRVCIARTHTCVLNTDSLRR